jgi:uncharacterized protein YfaP (DUF2135 family)
VDAKFQDPQKTGPLKRIPFPDPAVKSEPQHLFLNGNENTQYPQSAGQCEQPRIFSAGKENLIATNDKHIGNQNHTVERQAPH